MANTAHRESECQRAACWEASADHPLWVTVSSALLQLRGRVSTHTCSPAGQHGNAMNPKLLKPIITIQLKLPVLPDRFTDTSVPLDLFCNLEQMFTE